MKISTILLVMSTPLILFCVPLLLRGMHWLFEELRTFMDFADHFWASVL